MLPTAGNPAHGLLFIVSQSGSTSGTQPWAGTEVPGTVVTDSSGCVFTCVGSYPGEQTIPIITIPVDTDPPIANSVGTPLKTLADSVATIQSGVGFLNKANTWTATQTFQAEIVGEAGMVVAGAPSFILDGLTVSSGKSVSGGLGVDTLTASGLVSANGLDAGSGNIQTTGEVISAALQVSGSAIAQLVKATQVFAQATQLVSAAGPTAVTAPVVLCNTSSNAVGLTLPGSPVDGTTISIVDVSNNAAANHITVTGGTIVGSGTGTMNANSQSQILVYSTLTSQWAGISNST